MTTPVGNEFVELLDHLHVELSLDQSRLRLAERQTGRFGEFTQRRPHAHDDQERFSFGQLDTGLWHRSHDSSHDRDHIAAFAFRGDQPLVRCDEVAGFGLGHLDEIGHRVDRSREQPCRQDTEHDQRCDDHQRQQDLPGHAPSPTLGFGRDGGHDLRGGCFRRIVAGRRGRDGRGVRGDPKRIGVTRGGFGLAR